MDLEISPGGFQVVEGKAGKASEFPFFHSTTAKVFFDVDKSTEKTKPQMNFDEELRVDVWSFHRFSLSFPRFR
jgi:hypothetical protein